MVIKKEIRVTKGAIERLSKELNLPEPGNFTQDWEYEVSDPKRIKEFVEYYIQKKLTTDEKFTLMMVIISSCNDAIIYGLFDEQLWEEVGDILLRDWEIHKETIYYWSSDEEKDIEDCFAITPLIRKIKEKLAIEINK